MKIMRWCLPALKPRFQLRILNVPLGKSHLVVWALSYDHSPPSVKNYFKVGKGT